MKNDAIYEKIFFAVIEHLCALIEMTDDMSTKIKLTLILRELEQLKKEP